MDPARFSSALNSRPRLHIYSTFDKYYYQRLKISIFFRFTNYIEPVQWL